MKKECIDQKTQSNKQLFRVSQKVLFYDKTKKTFLLLKIAEIDPDEPRYAFWRKKYGVWDLPGGHVDCGEGDMDASLQREIYEEAGINDRVITKLCTRTVMENDHASHPGLTIIFWAAYDGNVILSKEHDAFRWMSGEEILSDKSIKKWIKDAVGAALTQIAQEESMDGWKRCMADFDNYKKRQSENQKEFIAYASEGVIMDMLPILDNFHAATDHVPEEHKDGPWVMGIMYIQQQMEKVLEENGVTKINIENGAEFDPHCMEAITTAKDQNISDHTKVIKVAQPGYKMGGKVLRPARVVLGDDIEK